MATTPANLSIKRPLAHRNDSALDMPTTSSKRQITTPTPINTQPQSRLFGLPFELRHMIYELALNNSVIPTLSTPNPSFPNSSSSSANKSTERRSALEPTFLRTCRLARHEGLPVFYSHNDFLINRRASLDFQHPLTMALNAAFPPPADPSKKPPSKSKSQSKWLYAMSDDKIEQIRTVVFAQLKGGMYKDEHNEWRRDATACFSVSFSKKRGKGYDIDYVRIDGSGRSERYAERLLKALDTRMEQLVRAKQGHLAWSRQDIWDMAYLL